MGTMRKWDYTHVRSASIALCLLFLLVYSILFYKLFSIRSLGETFLWCLMFIASILMSGVVIMWWMGRPDD